MTLLTLALLGANAADLHRVALVAGSNDGGAGRSQLAYAVDDARSLADVLVGMGGIAEANVHVLDEPDGDDILAELGRLSRQLESADGRTELFFYYSGHSDDKGLLPGGKRLPYRDLKAALDAVPADVKVTVLDACSSGALLRTKGGTHVPAFTLDEASEVTGHAILTSSSATEVAQESDRVGGSYFTHALVSGLRGAADVDTDGRVTLHEAYQFAFDETLSRTQDTLGGAQHANYAMQLEGSGDLVVTDLRGTTGRLALDKNVDGRLFVWDTDDRLEVELYKPLGRRLELGLDPGPYRLTLHAPREHLAADVLLTEGHLVELDLLDFDTLTLVETVARGDKVPKKWPIGRVALIGVSAGATLGAALSGEIYVRLRKDQAQFEDDMGFTPDPTRAFFGSPYSAGAMAFTATALGTGLTAAFAF